MRISDWSSDVCSSDLVLRAGGQTVLPDDQRAPFAGAVAVEARDIQGAVIEQVGVRGAVRRVEGAVGNELVDAPRCRIVAHVKGDAEIGRAACRDRECQYV